MATETKVSAGVKYKCVGGEGHCNKEFDAPHWECFAGQKHVVESKTYYMADAPHCDFQRDPNGLAYRTSRTELHAIPEDVRHDETGKIIKSSYQPATFKQGRFETSDPQYQFFLEHGAARRSLCTYERWYEVYHTPIQKQNIKDGKLKEREAELDRREKETNTLLAELRQKAGKGDRASA
jgi:hypothetical protein